MSGENDALEFDPGDPAANFVQLKQQPLPNPNGIWCYLVRMVDADHAVPLLTHCSVHWVPFWDARLE
jgi:hypothetical protein